MRIAAALVFMILAMLAASAATQAPGNHPPPENAISFPAR